MRDKGDCEDDNDDDGDRSTRIFERREERLPHLRHGIAAPIGGGNRCRRSLNADREARRHDDAARHDAIVIDAELDTPGRRDDAPAPIVPPPQRIVAARWKREAKAAHAIFTTTHIHPSRQQRRSRAVRHETHAAFHLGTTLGGYLPSRKDTPRLTVLPRQLA